MLRLRRYRVFVACAFVFVFMLYRVSVNSAWDSNNLDYQQAALQPNPQPQAAQRDEAQKPLAEKPRPAFEDTYAQGAEEDKVKIPELKSTTEVKDGFALPPAPTLADEDKRPAEEPPTPTEPPTPLIPDRRPGEVADAYPHAVEEPLHIQDPPGRYQDPPGRYQDPPGRYQDSPQVTPTSTAIHWEKQPEFFPVPEESIIPLPTGKPKSVPKVQHNFGSESPDAKAKREDRLAEVKAEMKRAWDGYEKYAFGHDELVPIEKSFKDPFCGWAATMVDAMDTLWIMGLKEEFDSAYEGLKDIDFTTTPTNRNDIPVFETTIRYLGGLLAAYDVTGGHKGHYPLLLKKAVELAEVLMGIFDTPNRMPVLYYKWKPAFASQPKRANTRAGIAELGTLSMEFTRLAQLTEKDKYYDAVARITDALEEWQNRDDETAPTLPGIFPENIDASGCNASATSALREASLQAQLQAQTAELGDPQGYVPAAAGNTGALDVSTQGRPGVEFSVKPGGEGNPDVGGFKAVEKRQVGDYGYNPESGVPPRNPAQVPDIGTPYRAGSSRFQSQPESEPLAANGLPANWDCVPKGLTAAPGMESFSMGGSQDSAYEYFPKQYLLLGGLEPKYRTLHEKTVAAVKKWLLFRPMVPDEPDVLFTAKIRVSSGVDRPLEERMEYEHEITHLTCFLGGMFGLGAKIFDTPEDLEIGKRLTDGCVWAYSAMPSGIMPEYSYVVPCKDAEKCEWNETLWADQYLDPNPEWRIQQMENYHERVKLWEAEKQQMIRDEAIRLQAAEEKARQTLYPGEAGSKAGIAQEPGVPAGYSGVGRGDGDERKPASDRPAGEKPASETPASDEDGYPRRKGNSIPSTNADGSPRRDDDVASRPVVNKRDVDGEASLLPTPDPSEDVPTTPAVDPATLDQQAIREKMKKLEAELNRFDATTGHTSSASSSSGSFGGTVGQVPIEQAAISLPPRPVRPDTHEEYVQHLIASEQLPPGFTRIGDKRYILRPEAIESVWYMYRITGDPIWQEKGWKMWKAVAKHTRSDVANTAVDGVNNKDGTTTPIDSMESFWLAETLKYYYLLYSEPDVISLDDWVLNTEAHPFPRPR